MSRIEELVEIEAEGTPALIFGVFEDIDHSA